MNVEMVGNLRLYFLTAPALYLVNGVIASFFAFKYKDDPIYKKNALIWVFYLILGVTQGVLQQDSNVFVKTMAWSFGAFLVISCMSAFIADLLKVRYNIWKDIYIFATGIVLSVVIFKTTDYVCLAALPSTFVAAYPVLKFMPLFRNIKDYSFAKNGILICCMAISLHVVDYAYFVNKPEYMFLGYLLALMLAIGASCFSFAVLIERAIIEVEMKDFLYNTARLTALGAMAAEIVHEIKNPLTVLSMNNYQIRQKIEVGQIDEAYLRTKVEVTERMTKRLMSILDSLKANFQSGDRDDFQTVRLRDVFEESKVLCEVRSVKHKVELFFDNSHEDVEIECRAVQITQILQNLIQNAIDVLEDCKGERWIRVQTQLISGGRELRLSVTDSGPGIPSAIRNKIFETLFTTKANGKGTGLGLSISKRFAEEHGGALFLADSPQTQFILLLPLQQFSVKTKTDSQSKVS